MDLDNLSPAPWETADDSVWTKDGKLVFDCRNEDAEEYGWDYGLDFDTCLANADFAVMARKAFDVMMRRKWTARLEDNGWAVCDAKTGMAPSYYPALLIDGYKKDPFTALVEADRWYKEHVEKEKP